MIDLCVLIFIGYFTVSGFFKGFIRIITHLLLFCFCAFISYLIYKITQNFILGGATLIISSLVLSILSKLFFKSLKNRHKEGYYEISFLNSLFGGIIGLLWAACWVFGILLIINLIPDQIPYISSIKENIAHSKSYQAISAISKRHKTISAINELHYLSKILRNEERLNKLRKQKDFQELLNNKKLQCILSNEETLQQIRNKDIVKIMNNPEFIVLLEDSKLIQQFLKIDFKKIVENDYSTYQEDRAE